MSLLPINAETYAQAIADTKAGKPVLLFCVKNGRDISAGKTYQVTGLDEDGDLKFTDNDGDTSGVSRPIDNVNPFMRIAETQEDVDAWVAEHKSASIHHVRMAAEVFNQANTFSVNDTIQWKPGMKDRKMPEYNQPAIILEVLPEPIKDAAVQEFGRSDAATRYDLLIGLIMPDGEFAHFYADSRRYEPTNK